MDRGGEGSEGTGVGRRPVGWGKPVGTSWTGRGGRKDVADGGVEDRLRERAATGRARAARVSNSLQGCECDRFVF